MTSTICTLPVDVTARTALRRAYLPALRASGPLGELLAHQAEAFARDEKYEETYGRTCEGLPDDIINYQHDPLACAVALGWDGVTIEHIRVGVEMREGWLYEQINEETGQTMRVVTAVDGARFNELWLSLVTASPS